VISAASSGILATTVTSHFNTFLGTNKIRFFARKLALLGKSGIRKSVLILTPLGE
jgi:hypothetical protein